MISYACKIVHYKCTILHRDVIRRGRSCGPVDQSAKHLGCRNEAQYIDFKLRLILTARMGWDKINYLGEQELTDVLARLKMTL